MPKGKGTSVPNSKPKGLTDKQKEMLAKHSEHHTQKHISLMRKLMKSGMSFTKAHNQAKKEVGK